MRSVGTLFLVCAGAWGAIAPVQNASSRNNVATSAVGIPLAYGSNNTAGNLLVAWAYTKAGSSDFDVTIADTAGNSWTQFRFDDSAGAAGSNMFIFYVCSAIAGANTVTAKPVSAASTAEMVLGISEWSGNATTSCLDKTGTGSNASSANPATSSMTPTVNGELIIGAAINSAANGTAGSGFTDLDIVGGGAVFDAQSEYQVQSSAGAITVNWTRAAQTWGAIGATFKPAGGATNSNTPSRGATF